MSLFQNEARSQEEEQPTTSEVENLIEKLVTSGSQSLDQDVMKKLKSLCKHSNECLEQCFQILLSHLVKDHSEVRLSTFQICSELFVRSHLFRTLLLKNFQQFMDCTVETDFDNPLPPPKAAADKLKQDALLAIKSWYEKYGIAYLRLSLAYEYLKNVKKIRFDQPHTFIQSRAQEQRLSRKKIVNGMKLDKLKKDVDENMWEVKNVASEIQTCLRLIVPTFKEDDDSDSNVEFDQTSSLREGGILDREYVVELDLAEVANFKVSVNEDNIAVFDRLKDLKLSANRIHFPRLRKWLNVATKCEATSDLIKTLIDTKLELQNAVTKCNSILNSGSDDEDCNDFVEVPDLPITFDTKNKSKKSSKPVGETNPNKKRKDTDIWKPMKDGDEDLNDSTTYKYALAKQAEVLKKRKNDQVKEGVQLKKLKKVIPMSQKTKQPGDTLKEKAPIVSFGHDLLAWEPQKFKEYKSTISLGAPKEYDVGHRFYGGNSASTTDQGVSEAALSSITTRIIEFSGDFEPVLQQCMVPLPNGKLCPRRDRYKCPFHGKIVPRDACGHPLHVADQPGTSSQPSSSNQQSQSDWNDPKFLQDLQENLGSAASVTRKKKKGKSEENGLTDLKKVKNTSRRRLQKKVLSVKSLKRVAETMNKLDAKRNLDKFGNNFNYALH